MFILTFILFLELIIAVFVGFDNFQKQEAEVGSAKTLSETLNKEQMSTANLVRKQLRMWRKIFYF
jgi:hypothetical protein